MSVCRQCGARISEPARCLNGHAVAEHPPIQVEGFADLIAQKVKAMLAEEFRVAGAAASARPEPARLVKAKELARAIGMSPRYVYDHPDELGAIRMGVGSKPRLRYDLDRCIARFADMRERGAVKVPPKAERRELPTDVELLPVKGRAA